MRIPIRRVPIQEIAGGLASLLLAFAFVSRTAAESKACCEDLIGKLTDAESAGRIEEAHRYATVIIEHERTTNPDGPLLPAALGHLASLDQDEAHFDEAERLYQESITLWEKQPEVFSPELAKSMNGLGSLYNAIGRLDRAEELCRRGLAVRLARSGPNNEEIAISYSNLGVVLLRQKKLQEAEAVARQALEIWNRLHSPQDRSAVDLNTLALVRLLQLDYQAATAFDSAAIRKCREFPQPDQWSLISYLHTLAVIRWNAGEPSESLAAFEEALAILQTSSSPNVLEKQNLLGDYGVILRKVGQKKKAKSIDQQAKSLCTAITNCNPSQRYVVGVSTLLPRP